MTAAPKKRGRPARPIIPANAPAKPLQLPKAARKRLQASQDPTEPAIAPNSAPAAAPTPADIDQAIKRELAAALQRSRDGHRLANHETRLLRDAWLHDQSMHLWPNLAAAAADLSISPSSLRAHGEAGCPGIEPHSPIPKAPVLAWLLKQAHTRGGDQGPTTATVEEMQLRLLSAKVDSHERRARELVQIAEDRATQGVIRAMSQLRAHLTTALPARLREAIQTEPDRAAAEATIASLIEQALRDHTRIDPPPEPTKATP